METVLVTGVAGFIGFHTALRLLDEGFSVVGVDNMNPYYDTSLKAARLALLQALPRFRFVPMDITDRSALMELMTPIRPLSVVHLAAQAGVRHSLSHPFAYIESNVTGFLSVLEASRAARAIHLVYASSSSVYGGNVKAPFSTSDPVDSPVSLYAATKKSNELMAHVYAHLYGLPTTGLRFFTVYGPWGRPDMAYFLFTKALFAKEPVVLYDGGELERDFTYIDDIVEGIVRVLVCPPTREKNHSSQGVPYRLYNLGGANAVKVKVLLDILERLTGINALRRTQPMQPGDVPKTLADTSAFDRDFERIPYTPLGDGLRSFIEWYAAYYRI